MKTKKTINVRLPSHIKAERYEITLKPDVKSFTFEGKETIHLVLDKPVRELTLHSKELEIVGIEFQRTQRDRSNRTYKTYKTEGSIIWAGKVKYNEKAETASFQFPKVLPKGKGKLKLIFRGVLNEHLRGFYRSKYIVNGTEQHMAVSQFEATDARRAFPCFDEPAHKAVFDVTMIVPTTHEAISNTLPINISEHEGGYKVVQFAPTPKMSTYLLAFISGEFEKLEKKTKHGVLVRVFTTPGKKHQAKFSLDVAVRTLDFFTDYFAIPYPLPVLDMIAVPDFAAGAMENWGAVTYRETQLLVDPKNSSAITKQWVAITVTHELAHQWFGNLVTMEWWTHLWLNEGFASYIEYLAVDHLFPDWHMWTQFAYLDYGTALEKDSLSDTHPIEVDVHHPDEIGEIFDDISYRKGASVIRMLASYLGEQHFRQGLRKYLKRHAYGNAATLDLWKAFEQVSGKPVRNIMTAWTKQTGLPLVTVEHGRKALKLSQQRFFINPKAPGKVTNKTLWPIPVSFALPHGKVADVLMTGRSLNLPLPTGPTVPKLNTGETGFYRVQYPQPAWDWFLPQIEHKNFSTLDRLGIISNARALSRAGLLPSKTLLSIVSAYKDEHDYTVWLEVLSAFGGVTGLSYGERYYEKLALLGQNLLSKVARRMGWIPKPSDTHTTSMLRAMVLQSYGAYGHKPTIAKALQAFNKMQKNVSSVPADLRSVVYNLAGRFGGVKAFKRLQTMYLQQQSPEEKMRLARAMATSRNPGLLKQALQFAISKHVRSQDTIRFTDAVGMNAVGGEVLWQFIQKHWDLLLSRYGQGGHMLSRIVEGLSGNTNTQVARQVKAFFKTHPAPGAERTVKQVLEQIQINSLWKERIRKEIG